MVPFGVPPAAQEFFRVPGPALVVVGGGPKMFLNSFSLFKFFFFFKTKYVYINKTTTAKYI